MLFSFHVETKPKHLQALHLFKMSAILFFYPSSRCIISWIGSQRKKLWFTEFGQL